jgi:hypothetical protein
MVIMGFIIASKVTVPIFIVNISVKFVEPVLFIAITVTLYKPSAAEDDTEIIPVWLSIVILPPASGLVVILYLMGVPPKMFGVTDFPTELEGREIAFGLYSKFEGLETAGSGFSRLQENKAKEKNKAAKLYLLARLENDLFIERKFILYQQSKWRNELQYLVKEL